MDGKIQKNVQKEKAVKQTNTEETDVEEKEDEDDVEEDLNFILTDDQKNELNLNKTTLAAIKDVFKSLDEDCSGTLDISELGTALTSLGVESSSSEVGEMILHADADGSGTLDFFEFAKMVSEKMRVYDPEQELREAFAVFDKDGDGKISVEEIRSVVESLGEKMSGEELENMLLDGDDNNDGFLDYAEFVKIWIGEESSSHMKNIDKAPEKSNMSSS